MSQPPGQSRALIATLLSDDAVASDAAAARLTILGQPAVRNLIKALGGASSDQRVRLISVLERIGDPLARTALATALDDESEPVAIAAASALAVLVMSERAGVGAASLDDLAAAALEPRRPLAVRLAALRALGRANDAEALSVVRARLLADEDAAMRAAARDAPVDSEHDGHDDHSEQQRPAGSDSAALLAAAAQGHLPQRPDALRHAVATTAGVSLTDLHRIIQHLVTEEREAPSADVAVQWRTVRASVHQALAARNSRLAVYDLRETIERLGAATPVGILSALQHVGDLPALESLADAWARDADEWFRTQLATAFAAIVTREGVTRRHAVIRKIAQRAPDALAALWPAATPAAISTPSRNRP